MRRLHLIPIGRFLKSQTDPIQPISWRRVAENTTIRKSLERDGEVAGTGGIRSFREAVVKFSRNHSVMPVISRIRRVITRTAQLNTSGQGVKMVVDIRWLQTL